MTDEKRKKILNIVIGGDSDKDDRELLEHPEKAAEKSTYTLYLESYNQLHHWLTPAKLNLVYELMKEYSFNENDLTINQLARETKRKQEAVSRDISVLKKMNFVQLKKKGREVHVSTPFKAIHIEIAGN